MVQVQGLRRTNLNADGGQGFANALSGFQNQIRPNLPLDASGVWLRYKINPTASGLVVDNPQNINITENQFLGTVQYSYSYTDDPAESLPSGIAERTCSVNKTFSTRVFASHPIPFRFLGNKVQDIETTKEGRIVITCSATAKNTGDNVVDTNRAINYVEEEYNRLRPNTADYVTLRLDDLQFTYSDVDLTATVTGTSIFTQELSAAPTAEADISLPPIT